MIDYKKIWLSEGSAMDARNHIPLSYTVTLNKIDIRISTHREVNQIHLRMDTDDLILLRNAIDKEIRKHSPQRLENG